MWIYSLTYDYYIDTWFWLNNITKKKKEKKNKQDVIAMKASVTKGNCNMQKG